MFSRTDSPSYGFQLAQGATTLTEAWDANPASSQNHFMLGHGEEWFYRGLAGIRLDMTRGADDAILLQPSLLPGVAKASATHRTPMGEVSLAWSREGEGASIDVSVPAGAQARLLLPAADRWSEGSVGAIEADGRAALEPGRRWTPADTWLWHLSPAHSAPAADQALSIHEDDTMRFSRIAAVTSLSVCLLWSSLAQRTDETSIVLQADAKAPGKPLVHFWSKVVGAGRANEALRATWQEELRTAHEYGGFQYVRFHGIFHDDMFVYREDKDGHPIYNFQYVDDVFDRMLASGVKPFVELGFVPKELATVTNTDFWWQANGSPPNDYGKWAQLVSHLVQHCISRYGAEEVRSWYFEVWNEPNLRYFFKNGTQAQYFELYKITAQTLKAIDPQLRVGGPATSNFHIPDAALQGGAAKQIAGQAIATGQGGDWQPIWVEAFLKYCDANHLPVDFVSTHPYPTDFPLDVAGESQSRVRRNIDSTRNDLATLRRIVNNSAYPHAEIQLTEWSSSPSPLDHSHDSLPAAAFIAKTNLESIGLVDSLSYWVFTDVFEEERNTDSVFHGGFGLINYQQIVKPAFHAYRFLNELGDTTLAARPGAIITRDSHTQRIAAVAYNYPAAVKVSLPKTATVDEADKLTATGAARSLSLTLTGLRPGATVLLETVDKSHGNAVAAWEQMGRPEPPTREQTELLRRAAWATLHEYVHADEHGTLTVRRPLEAWSIMLIKQLD